MRDSFIFYRSFYESLDGLNDKQKLEIFNAICKFSLNFEEVELTGISKNIFTLIKPNLDANNKRYINGTKGKEYGVKGGRPVNTKETPNITPKKPQENPKHNPKETPNKDKDKDKDKDVNEAVAFLKSLSNNDKKILKDNLGMKDAHMYVKENGENVSFTRYVYDSFFDPIYSPRLKKKFNSESDYWKMVSEFIDLQIVSDNYKNYISPGQIRKHFINWHNIKTQNNDNR